MKPVNKYRVVSFITPYAYTYKEVFEFDFKPRGLRNIFKPWTEGGRQHGTLIEAIKACEKHAGDNGTGKIDIIQLNQS